MKELVNLLNIHFNILRNNVKNVESKGRLKAYILLFIAVCFLISIFAIFYRILDYFNEVPLFGPVLTTKLLAMVFLTFFFMLLFSNIIVAISTFYLSDDMSLLLSTPIRETSVLISKFFQTLINSSWMVFFIGIPIFAAYTYIMKANFLCFIYSMTVLVIFLMLAASISMGFTIILMRVFPAKRARDIFVFLSVGFISVLTVLIRLMQPEKFTNPNELWGVMEFMSSLNAPTAPCLPSSWAASSIIANLNGNLEKTFGYFVLLLAVTVVCCAVLIFLSKKLFLKGWWNACENQLEKYKKKFFDKVNPHKVFFFISNGIKELVIKDIRVFVRDSSQWPQLLILIAIAIIYLFNVSHLPLDRLPANIYAKYVKDIIFFLNMGFAGFIIAAVSTRFVFSSISIEGKSFWVIKLAPISPTRFLWEKFWLSLFPLVALSEILILLSIYFMKIDFFMSMVSIITILIFSFCLTAMGVGFGGIFPKFHADNTAEIATSYGGILYMIFAVIYIGISLVLIAGPINMYYSSKVILRKINLHYVVVSLTLFAVVQFIAFYIPMKLGKQSLEKLEV